MRQGEEINLLRDLVAGQTPSRLDPGQHVSEGPLSPRQTRLLLMANYVPLQSTRRKSINITMPKSDPKAALLAIEKVLALLRSVQALEGTDKDGVEHLLEMAVENLKN